MQWYEVEACLSGLENKSKAGWEQTRLISYIIAQVNNTKKLKLTDILSFKWDNVEDCNKETTITEMDIKRLKDKSNQTLKQMNNGRSNNETTT